jgi:LacI family transcriptional regulator
MPSRSRNASVTIRDVAKRAGVSIATVSRVLNQTVPVADETVARVQAAMQELRFVPHTVARHLATRQTQTVGLLLTDIQGDFFAPMLSGIESVTRDAGFDLLISTSGRPEPRRGPALPLGPHNTDGILVFAGSLDEGGLAQYAEWGFPLVLIHQSSPPAQQIPCVTVENKAASRQIVEHLIEAHGRRRIAFLRGPQGNEDSYWRETGYRQALAAHGIAFRSRLVAPGDFDRWVARASVQGMLAAGVAFDAVFSGDDEAAVGVLLALQEAGKRVPADVAVVGFDDQRLSAYLTPPLTTVRAPTEEVGRAAAQQLVQLIRTGHADLLTLLPTEIVIRRSCGCEAPR